MAQFGVEHQIFQIINVEDQTTAIFKWERWQRYLVFVYAICSLIVISGEAMIIIYIGKYAPKDRAINKIILVDQVSNLRPNISTPKLSPTLQQTSKHCPYLTTYPQRVPKQHPQWHTLQEIGNYNFINISSVVEF